MGYIYEYAEAIPDRVCRDRRRTTVVFRRFVDGMSGVAACKRHKFVSKNKQAPDTHSSGALRERNDQGNAEKTCRLYTRI